MLHRALLVTILLAGCAPAANVARQPSADSVTPRSDQPARFLYVWAGDVDEKDPDFLAVVDIRRGSPTYRQVLTTVPSAPGA
jgi:hypothetical protein